MPAARQLLRDVKYCSAGFDPAAVANQARFCAGAAGYDPDVQRERREEICTTDGSTRRSDVSVDGARKRANAEDIGVQDELRSRLQRVEKQCREKQIRIGLTFEA